MISRDSNIVYSSLSREVTVDGVKVDVKIYKLEGDPQWALEVINEQGTSVVWEVQFDSDAEAYAAFQLVVDEEGMQAFLDEDNVTPFPRGRRSGVSGWWARGLLAPVGESRGCLVLAG